MTTLKVDYRGLATAIKTKLQESGELDGVPILIERSDPVGEVDAWLAIYVTTRRPDPSQPIAAGTRLRLIVSYTVQCYGLSLSEDEKAFERRDELIAKVESVLLGVNRTLDAHSYISEHLGGDFGTARSDTHQALVAVGTVDFEVSTTAIA